MTDVRIATGAEQPVHSDGNVSTVTLSEGDLVGLDASGELVGADAATGVQVPAVGIAAVPVEDPSNYPTGQFEYAAKAAEANRAAINDEKVGYVKYGAELYNQDEDWGFSTDGDARVYLDEGGGFTQTRHTDAGDITQVVGHAINGGESIMLDVQSDFTIN